MLAELEISFKIITILSCTTFSALIKTYLCDLAKTPNAEFQADSLRCRISPLTKESGDGSSGPCRVSHVGIPPTDGKQIQNTIAMDHTLVTKNNMRAAHSHVLQAVNTDDTFFGGEYSEEFRA